MAELYQSMAPKFRSRKAFVNYAQKINEIINNRGDEAESARVISQFICVTTDFEKYLISARRELENAPFIKLFILTGECLATNQWNLTAYQHALLRLVLSYQINFYNKENHRIHFALTDPSRELNTIGLPTKFGDITALMAIFGNKELFENTTKFCLDLFDKKLVGGGITPLTQLFIMRLSERYLELDERNWLADPYKWAVDPSEKEPLFKALMQHWNDEDTQVLEPLLIQLLNRHTFQASRNNKDGGKDFDGHTEQFPLEVFFIFRLRQWSGLSIPILKHKMMEL
jgi:hypothetical protein